MNKKRVVSLVTVMVLIFTMLLGSSVYAADISDEKLKLMIAAGEVLPAQNPTEESAKVKKDDALTIAKTMLEDASLFEMSNMYFNSRWGASGGAAWSVDFMRKQQPGGNANVTVDADTGEILGFSIWNYQDGQQNYVAQMTRSEAVVNAEEFLKNRMKLDMNNYELQPEDPYANSYRMGGVKEPVIYNYTFFRKIDGVFLSNDSLNVGVDGTSGKVSNFNRAGSTADLTRLPSTDGIMTAEQAMSKYKESLNLALQYMTVYQDSPYGISKPKVMLAYVPSLYMDMIDAITGKAVGYDGNETDLTDENLRKLASEPRPMDPAAVLKASAKTEDEAREIAEKYKLIAEDILKVKFDLNMPQGVYYGPQNDVWNFSWNKNADNINYNFYITINRTTGNINNLSLGKYDYLNDRMIASGQQKPAEVKENVSWTAGREKALELVKKLAPDQYGFYADQNIKEPAFSDEIKKTIRDHSYSFTRVVNGILYRDNTINLGIDRETGDIKNFYFSWTDAEFPQTTALIAKDTAAVTYFEGTEARLSYFQKQTYNQSTGINKVDPVPMLVYSFARKGSLYGGGVYVDASTGKLVDWGGRVIKTETSAPEPQLDESWAKRSVELLIAQGIIKDPFIDYEAGLTRAEAVKMLSIAKGYQYYYDQNQLQTPTFSDVPKDNEYFTYVENAVRLKIISAGNGKFNGSEKLTREEFAKLLVNMIGYSDIAKYRDIFKLNGITAVNSANTGYIAICSALDILPVKDGDTFDGSGNVTGAEAAVALYKALSFVK